MASSGISVPPDTDKNAHEDTEILVTAVDYVVALQMQRETFQHMLQNAGVVTLNAVQQFEDKWKEDQKIQTLQRHFSMPTARAIKAWDALTKRCSFLPPRPCLPVFLQTPNTHTHTHTHTDTHTRITQAHSTLRRC